MTQPDDTTAATINRPSDGSERAVANHLFLVATSEPTGELGHFYVQADNAYVLAGSKVDISAAAVDTNYIPMDEDYDYDLEASDGELDGNILTTPKRGGEITVTASSGRREGSTTVYAIEDPTDVVIRDSSGTALTTLNAATGTTTQLAATAAYNHISLKADPEAFTWDGHRRHRHSGCSTGLFTAAAPGTGTITVSAGRARVSIPVTVSSSGTVSAGGVMEVESFEGSTTIFRGSGSDMDFSLNHSADTVRMGQRLRQGGLHPYRNRRIPKAPTPPSGGPSKSTGIDRSTYTALHLWVYGDGSGNILSLLYSDGTQAISPSSVTPLDFTGWKQVTFANLGDWYENLWACRSVSPPPPPGRVWCTPTRPGRRKRLLLTTETRKPCPVPHKSRRINSTKPSRASRLRNWSSGRTSRRKKRPTRRGHPGSSFDEIDDAVRTAKNPEATTTERERAAKVFTDMEGTELYEKLMTGSSEMSIRIKGLIEIRLKKPKKDFVVPGQY